MTRIRESAAKVTNTPGRWALQDAKARFSEVVRKAKTEGPQKITVHGREEVVMISIEEYRRAKGQPTGELLIKVMQDPRARGLRIERVRTPARTRRVKL
jgi:prevent-host-death family protein